MQEVSGFTNGNISIIPLSGTEELTARIEYYLEQIYTTGRSKIIDRKLVRFSTGDGKAVLGESVRGTDVYIIADVGNHSVKYKMYGKESYMSPDDHFQDLKRVISAVGGKANRVNVIMPLLYSSRQDRRIARESLDCAVALKELEDIGVKNIMVFDAHDDRVQNAVPFIGFDNLMPVYQVIKKMFQVYPDLEANEENMVVISPDFGGANRNLLYANALGLDMGMFYKRRSKNVIVNGSYAIEEHKYIGPDVKGKDVLICDDFLASGTTMLDVVKKIKEMGAARINISVTFGLFTNGIEEFKKAYEDGLFEAVFATNATYRLEELRNEPWYKEVDISKYVAYYIYCVNTGKSISTILDPNKKISALLEERCKKKQAKEQEKVNAN